jgi:hypothetical protein
MDSVIEQLHTNVREHYCSKNKYPDGIIIHPNKYNALFEEARKLVTSCQLIIEPGGIRFRGIKLIRSVDVQENEIICF